MKAGLAAAAIAAVALVAGCGSSDAIPQSKLSSLVLKPADLPALFSVFDEGAQVRVDAVPGPRQDPQRFGREGGWKARYHRSGSRSTVGPLVVESRADLFHDAGGAKKDLDAYRGQFEQTIGTLGSSARIIGVPRIGDAAIGLTVLQPGTVPVRFYTVAWRDRNATASVTVDGFEGKVRLRDAVALARRQERRIAAL